MKVNQEQVKIASTLGGREIAMTMDAAATAHLMGILTEMYSDPMMAIVRELATNAADSHVEAGIDSPIVVTTPNALAAEYVVEDWGVGLSLTDLEAIFLKYGASTKRDTNEQTGCLGIGSKSPLAYTDQFTLTTRKDGREIIAIVCRTAEGGGTMRIVSDAATDNVAGVKIVIPVKHADADAMGEKARTFFSFWPEGLVLVDGKAPAPYEDPDAMRLSDTLVLVKKDERSGRGSSYTYARHSGEIDATLVMGNVPYPVDGKHITPALVNTIDRGLVIEAPIGAVDIAPSREALRYTPRTVAYLKAIADEIDTLILATIQDEVADCDDRPAVMEVVIAHLESLTTTGKDKLGAALMWKGSRVPVTPVLPTGDGVQETSFHLHDGTLQGRYYMRNRTGLERLANTFVITEFTNTELSITMRRKLIAYMRAHHPTGSPLDPVGPRVAGTSDGVTAYTTPKKWSWEWMPTNQVVKWDTVKKWKIATVAAPGAAAIVVNQATVKVRRKSTSGYGQFDYEEEPINTITDDARTLVFNGAIKRPGRTWDRDHEEKKRELVMERLLKVDEKLQFVTMPANRYDKFMKEHPNARDAHGVHREEQAKWWKSLTPRQRKSMNTTALPGVVTAIPVTKVTDPKLVEALKVAESNRSVKNPARFEVPETAARFEYDLADAYPLVAAAGDPGVRTNVPPNHVLTYVNAIHEGRQTEEGSDA